MTFLLGSIYGSEVAHGVVDHFDNRLIALGAMAPSSTKQETGHQDAPTRGLRRGWFWRRVRTLSTLTICLALLIGGWLTFTEWNDRRVALAQVVETTSALDQSLARLAQELPPYYFACMTGQQNACVDRDTTSNLTAEVSEALRRFDRTLLILEQVDVDAGTAAIFGVTSAGECSNTSRALVVLCQSRQRFFERRTCLERGRHAAPICNNHIALGIAGTRYEEMVNPDELAVANIFSRPVALIGEIEQLLEVTKGLREDPLSRPFWQNVAKRAETCCLSYLGPQ